MARERLSLGEKMSVVEKVGVDETVDEGDCLVGGKKKNDIDVPGLPWHVHIGLRS